MFSSLYWPVIGRFLNIFRHVFFSLSADDRREKSAKNREQKSKLKQNCGLTKTTLLGNTDVEGRIGDGVRGVVKWGVGEDEG